MKNIKLILTYLLIAFFTVFSFLAHAESVLNMSIEVGKMGEGLTKEKLSVFVLPSESIN
ncbi:hypothetical protein GMMP15_660046 [Candidatus Magnetomoraceae bacterium gMMP-15]